MEKTFFLGGATHGQSGFRRDNWSLLEFVLLDLKHNQVLMQAEGRGWATLDRPGVAGISQWYPAIYLDQLPRSRHLKFYLRESSLSCTSSSSRPQFTSDGLLTSCDERQYRLQTLFW